MSLPIIEAFETITLTNKARINYVNQDFAKFSGKLHNFISKANEEHNQLVKSEYIPSGYTLAFKVEHFDVPFVPESLTASADHLLNDVLAVLIDAVKTVNGAVDVSVVYSRDYTIFPVKARIVR